MPTFIFWELHWFLFCGLIGSGFCRFISSETEESMLVIHQIRFFCNSNLQYTVTKSLWQLNTNWDRRIPEYVEKAWSCKIFLFNGIFQIRGFFIYSTVGLMEITMLYWQQCPWLLTCVICCCRRFLHFVTSFWTHSLLACLLFLIGRSGPAMCNNPERWKWLWAHCQRWQPSVCAACQRR